MRFFACGREGSFAAAAASTLFVSDGDNFVPRHE